MKERENHEGIVSTYRSDPVYNVQILFPRVASAHPG